MRIIAVILILCSLILVNCDDDKKNTNNLEGTEKSSQDARITVKNIESLEYKDYALSTEAQNAVANWESYQELALQISYFKKADLSFVDGEKDLLKKFILALKTQIPEHLRTNPIESRIVIIETTLLKLNENLSLPNIEKDDKLLGIKEVFIAFSNLNYQINKKLERDMYDKIQAE